MPLRRTQGCCLAFSPGSIPASFLTAVVHEQILARNNPPPRGPSPTDGVRVWPSQVGHLIQDVAREECLGRRHSPRAPADDSPTPSSIGGGAARHGRSSAEGGCRFDALSDIRAAPGDEPSRHPTHRAAVSRGDQLVTNDVQPQHARFIPGLKVATDSVPYRLAEGAEGVSLREDGGAQGAGGESTFGGLFDQKHQLIHDAITARGWRPWPTGSIATARHMKTDSRREGPSSLRAVSSGQA